MRYASSMVISPSSPILGSALDAAREGMGRANRRFEDAARRIAGGDVSSSRMVDMIVSERMFQANASVARTQDEMIGAFLNVRR